MATRNKSPLSFKSIQYTAANKDKRWYVELPDDLQLVTGLDTNDALATVVNDMLDASGSSSDNSIPFGNTSVLADTTHGAVTVAFRIPQTKRILDFVMKKDASSDHLGLFDSKSLGYEIYVSGRSDKKYSEIIDWVKVCDNTDQQSDLNSNVFLPDQVAGDTYVTNNALRFHAKCFPYYTSWVKIVFTDVRTRRVSNTSKPDLFLSQLRLYDFIEDTVTSGTSVEKAPTVSMVFPGADSKWLPSQTVYFTARAYEPNCDACHFSFEIYKEMATTAPAKDNLDTSADTLMYTIDSNMLNLDGSVNENYTHTWHGLPVKTASYTNKVYLPGYPQSSGGAHPTSVLIVPTAASTSGTVTLSNIQFYDNIGNQLKYDCSLKSHTFSAITITNSTGVSKTGWLVNFHDNTSPNPLPISVKFNRIDFTNASSGATPTKVEVYYCGGGTQVASQYNTVLDGIWNVNNAGEVFRAPTWESQVEFCWPAVNAVATYDPAAATRPLVGYKEGLADAIANDPDAYNPDRNGIGIDQTNAGDWAKVPKFAGLLVGPAFSTINTSTDTYAASNEYGDSPVPTEAAAAGQATIITPAGTGIVTTIAADNPIKSGTGSGDLLTKDVAHRIVYVRCALPDPYKDGERFYAICKVWDGRTKIV